MNLYEADVRVTLRGWPAHTYTVHASAGSLKTALNKIYAIADRTATREGQRLASESLEMVITKVELIDENWQ